jgi:imidazolonepropionase-like amidohydrolase
MQKNVGLLCGLLLYAEGCALPAAPAQGTQGRTPNAILFRGARVIVGDGTAIDPGAFVVQHGLIMRVGRASDIQAPPGALTVDLKGRTVMPAIVNAHSHLGWEKYTSWGSQNFTRENLIDHLHRHAYTASAP